MNNTIGDETLEKIYVEDVDVDEEDEEECSEDKNAASSSSGKPKRKFPTKIEQLPPATAAPFYNDRTPEQSQKNAKQLYELYENSLLHLDIIGEAACHYQGARNTKLDISPDMFLRVQGTLPQVFFDDLLSVDIRSLTPEKIIELMGKLPQGWVVHLADEVS